MGVDADSGSEEKMVRNDANLKDESKFVFRVYHCVCNRVGDRGESDVGFRWEGGVSVT